ncbi:hypothetical protein QYE76_003845 [Lolium multiflorum]|uniref:Gag-pol polyprotein n=1 Tax=Lolium multiflorum TaxID=4521 RepID=A0AAD8RR47_LOLMU|nr:hypothetical protein QYE76_003845 [Lolium multiflorum]
MKAEVLEEVKKEIKKMLDAGFIRPCGYAEWISNVVPVEKKDGRWRVAIDFGNLNEPLQRTYPMPIVPGSVGLFEYVVMTFGLKNAGATYQRAMNYIFHDLIGKLVEIYIDDVVVKSVSTDGHLEDLRQVLDRTRKFGLRMNPKKCAFGVTAGQFLGFLVHERGIEIGLKSQEAVRTMKPPTTKKELQCLIGKINFVRRYQPAKAVKGQALADLIAERINTDVAALSVRAWAMFFDGSVCEDGCGIGVLLVSPRGATYSFSIRLANPCTNNVAEYEAICKGMELLLEAGAEAVEIFGDSKLVISQLTEEYKCESESLFPLWVQCRELMAQFRNPSKEIFSESDEIKTRGSYFHRKHPEHPESAEGGLWAQGERWRGWAWRPLWCRRLVAPPIRLFAYLKVPDLKPRYGKATVRETFQSRRHREAKIWGTGVSVPARRRDGEVLPEGFYINTTAIFITAAAPMRRE